ncbi:HK97 family phage prohead protease [Nocardia cyriacigeorgica]|uniref:HK97 family phage prohead protease n=1 Tax=Nocardia cyriacigeorgica TaxID=135487 RepID=A0ABX0CYG8_9NOCA|nr:HK97 family phage prohead protease [Nocardia cyriacigeorgica]NEW58589.1 HK97 family phage prohead protease [Nocardia cyriacigeorgica]
MNTVIHRSAPVAAESITGRTVHGVVVPYGQVATVRDSGNYGQPYKERFEMGAFARSIEERGHKIRLMVAHNERSLPIGRAVELIETTAGLRAAFLVSDTGAGNDALRLIADGVVDSFSVGFSPVRHRMDGDVVVRTEVALREVSLVAEPAYSKALVAGIRTADIPVIDHSTAMAAFTLIFE